MTPKPEDLAPRVLTTAAAFMHAALARYCEEHRETAKRIAASGGSFEVRVSGVPDAPCVALVARLGSEEREILRVPLREVPPERPN